MRIAIFGAGAVGSHIAARLVQSGVPVAMVARGAQLRAIQDQGLSLLAGDARIPTAVTAVTAVAQAADLGVQDLAIVAVKGTQLGAAVDDIRPLVGPGTRLLFAMNGLPWWFAEGMPQAVRAALSNCLDPSGRIATLAPPAQVIWGVVTAGAAIVAPGIVRSTTPSINRIQLGYPDDRTDAPLQQAAALLAAGGFTAMVATPIREAIWAKLLLNAGQAMVATVTNRDHLAVTSDPETRAIIMAVIRELSAIGAAIGLHPLADPLAMTEPTRFGAHIPSFLQDLRAGRALELDSTILAARSIGRALDLPIPHLTTIAAIVAAQSADAAARPAG